MNINEKGINRIAFILTSLFHLLILFIQIPYSKEIIKTSEKKYRIPVQMKIVESKHQIRQGNEKKPIISKPKKNRKVPRKQSKKVVKAKKKEKPTSLPGDRKTAVVSESFTPVYPKAALNNNWVGKVELLVLIDGNGQAINVEVIKSSGHAILDQSFIRTVKNYYKFKPKRVMGENITSKIRLSYEFE